MVTILMMSAKMATLGLLKITLFGNNSYDVRISNYDITNKISSCDSNYIIRAVSKWHPLSMNNKYLNGYTKRWCTKYELLLTSSDIGLNLEKFVSKLM